LQPPLLNIKEDADDNAHLDLVNPEVIKFKFANSTHKDLIKDRILKPNMGICHGVFSEEITTAN